MNLRDIKKDIEYVVSAFVDDCYLFATIKPEASDDALSELLDKAIDLYNDLRDKVNVKVDGGKKAYYDSIRKELLEETDALYTALSDVVKKAAKAA